ncbi:MAG: glycosyltransferase [Flavobacteriales bacterium]|nr:glycosyltransferase [Flavobacteriales bacterium]
MAHILYLTYDGLTDNLGRSQIIPYINGLAQIGHFIWVISVDKADHYATRHTEVESQLHSSISWVSIRYTKRPPLLSTIYDLRRMQKAASQLVREKRIQTVHVRSYPPMSIALKLAQSHGVKVLFDMRGFYPEERIEGGIWNLRNPIHRAVYNRLKKKELNFIEKADHIISLTEKAKNILMDTFNVSGSKVTVIPCCADFEHFRLAQTKPPLQPLKVLYLGSLGTWYLIPTLVQFFQRTQEIYPDAQLHVITGDHPEQLYLEAGRLGVASSSIHCRSAEREEVPELIGACHLSVFFIKDSFSKSASSPTKLAEILASGRPVICNGEIGDLNRLSTQLTGLYTLHLSDIETIDLSKVIEQLMDLDPNAIRNSAKEILDLDVAIAAYTRVHAGLSDQNSSTSVQ